MTLPFLIEDRRDGVLLLTMNGAEDRNALSRPEQCDEFVAAAGRINADTTLKAVILTGAGPAFCAGGNIKHMSSHEGFMAGSPVEMAEGYRASLQRIALALYELELPLIAAVNGPAMGAGLDLTCMCDIRIASDQAKFAETFIRLGIISGIGGAWLLPRVVGAPVAADLSFTGRVIGAEQALAYGLVSEILPRDALLERAWSLAGEIAANSGVALRYCKRLLRMGARTDLRSSLEATAALQSLAHQSPEHERAVAAFLAERQGASERKV